MRIYETQNPVLGPPDWELLAAIPGDLLVFGTFYRRHVDHVVRHCTSLLRVPDEVADAVANTFTAVLTSSSTFDIERGEASVWLTDIAARMIALSFRQRQRRENLQLRVAGAASALATVMDSLSPRPRGALSLSH